MNGWVPLKRGTLLADYGRDDGIQHLFIVMNDPYEEETGQGNKTLLVNVTSIPANPTVFFDDTCILNVGDHPFLQHRSYVYYKNARIEATQDVIDKVAAGHCVICEEMNGDVFRQVANGISDSEMTPEYIINFFQEARGDD